MTAHQDSFGRELNTRSLEVLEAVVRLYTETGHPVSSSLLERYLPSAPSSATLRTVMKNLEKQGLLEQPHTSAGRLPTDSGFRIFVNRLRAAWALRKYEVPVGMLRLLEHERPNLPGQGQIKDLARLLSVLTRNISIIVGPSLESVAAVRLEFYPRTTRRLLMVLILDNGQVQTRQVELPEGFAPAVVNEAARLLSARIQGRTLGEIRREGLNAVDLVRTPVSRCAEALAREGSALLEDLEEGEVELEGVGRMLDEPEFQDAEPLKALIRFIESPRTIRDSLSRLHGSGQHPFGVWIGRENPIGALHRFSVLTAGFEIEGRQGLLAVVGPRRLTYQRALQGLEVLRRVSGGHPQVPAN